MSVEGDVLILYLQPESCLPLPNSDEANGSVIAILNNRVESSVPQSNFRPLSYACIGLSLNLREIKWRNAINGIKQI